VNTVLLVALVLLSLVYFWFWWRRKAAKAPVRNPEDFEDLNEKFLRNTQGKSGAADLVRAFEPGDLSALRSLLDAEGIESYVVESPVGNPYPLETIPGFAESTITVYRIDYEEGRRVVEDYLAEDGASDRQSCRPVLLDPSAP